MTIRAAYLKSRETLARLYGDDESLSISKRLFEDVFSISSNVLVLQPEQPFTHEKELDVILDRLLASEPLQHITGFEWFRGMHITVSQDVLIPRPETAELLDWVLSEKAGAQSIADICTGSGCIALALRKGMAHADITATDISVKALEMASKNERDNFNDKKIRFAQHDILNEPWTFPVPELVVCNPPYIAGTEALLMHRNVLAFEPHEALFVAGEDTLVFYRKIIDIFLPAHPVDIFFELNPLSAGELRMYCTQKKLRSEFRQDMQGKIRFAHISL